MGWSLLKSVDDWDKYKQHMQSDHALSSSLVNWGNGPKHYPCLVSSAIQPTKIMSCYTYLPDALQLVAAAGLHVTQSPIAQTPDEVPGHTMADFAKSVAAHLLAIYDAMESMHITNKDRHEQDYLRYLGMVDRYHAADKADAAAQLSEGQQFILEQLFPEDPDATSGK